MGQMPEKDKLSIFERIYVVEILRGLSVTTRRFFNNLINRDEIVTTQYPEEIKGYPERFRARHRLTMKPDGSVRCTACMLCATACPSFCITIDAGEHDDLSVEKYPKKYEIDVLRCVYCGLCVEACPLDALRMDTNEHPPAEYNREDFIEGKDLLMKRSANFPSIDHP